MHAGREIPRRTCHARSSRDGALTAHAMDSLLRIESFSKKYPSLWALQDATFDVRAGEILGLIGPNGSGKTTLFACVAGAMPATTGRLLRDGRVLPDHERKQTLFYVPD